MKIRLLLALVGLAISFAVPTFAQQTKHSRSTNCASRFVGCAKKSLAMYSTTAMPPPWPRF
jgi:hypothetical protein